MLEPSPFSRTTEALGKISYRSFFVQAISDDYVRIDRRFQPQSKKSMLTIKPTFVIRMIIVKGRKKNEAREVALYIAKQNAKNTGVHAKQTENW